MTKAVSDPELVVLVDEDNNVVGSAKKSAVHTNSTPLHRGFSVFLFNSSGKLLLQQRAKSKLTWPGIWSNSCCGHPGLNETFLQAAKRRMKQELGLNLNESEFCCVLEDFRYSANLDGVVENEICPVFVVVSDKKIHINPVEIAQTKWIEWNLFISEIKKSNNYSPWCNQEALLLNKSHKFKKIIQNYTKALS